MQSETDVVRRAGNFWKWFDPRSRDLGSWAFIINRVSGLGLTLYLFLHLAVLSTLTRGPEAYDTFIRLVKNPVFLFGEFLVVAAGLLHGLNGLRIILTSFGIGVSRQKALLIGLTVVALAGCAYFALRMFGGEL